MSSFRKRLGLETEPQEPKEINKKKKNRKIRDSSSTSGGTASLWRRYDELMQRRLPGGKKEKREGEGEGEGAMEGGGGGGGGGWEWESDGESESAGLSETVDDNGDEEVSSTRSFPVTSASGRLQGDCGGYHHLTRSSRKLLSSAARRRESSGRVMETLDSINEQLALLVNRLPPPQQQQQQQQQQQHLQALHTHSHDAYTPSPVASAPVLMPPLSYHHPVLPMEIEAAHRTAAAANRAFLQVPPLNTEMRSALTR